MSRTGKLYHSLQMVREGDGTLLCVSRRDIPCLFAEIQLPGGGMLEPVDRPGIGALTHELMSHGAADFTPLEWRKALDRNALGMWAWNSEDMAGMAFDCLSKDTAEALMLYSRWVGAPSLPKAEWKAGVKKLRASAREEWAQPMNVIDRLALVQAVGRRHPAGRHATEKHFAEASCEEALDFAASALRRNDAYYGIIGGDIGMEEGYELLRKMISAFKTGGKTKPPEPQVVPSRFPVWIMNNEKVDQAFFALTGNGIRAGDPDRVALRVADHAIGGGGFSSRLMKRVREKMGHTYGIHSSLPEKTTASPFMITSFTNTENLGAMLSLVRQVLTEITKDGLTEVEIGESRDYLHGSRPLKLTNPHAILANALDGIRAGLTIEDLETDWQSAKTIAADEVNRAARRIIGDGRFALAVIGPAKKILPQVKEWGETAVFPFKSRPESWPA